MCKHSNKVDISSAHEMIMNDSHSSWSTSCWITHLVGVHCALPYPCLQSSHMVNNSTPRIHRHRMHISMIPLHCSSTPRKKSTVKRECALRRQAHELIGHCFRPPSFFHRMLQGCYYIYSLVFSRSNLHFYDAALLYIRGHHCHQSVLQTGTITHVQHRVS